MRTDNTKSMAAFGRGVSSMIVLGGLGCLQVFALGPLDAYARAADWPALLLGIACINMFTAVAFYVVYGFWFKVPR